MNSNRVLTPYILTGDPDTLNQAIDNTGITNFVRPGELGAQFDCNRNGRGFKYQLVKLDSGAANASSGLVAAGQIAYWKDHNNYLVTNDYRSAEPELVTSATGTNAFANFVAGVFRTAVTAGNACMILQRGYNIKMKATSGLSATGMMVVANVSTPAADVTGIAVGSGINTYRALGVCRVPYSAGYAYCDLEIPDFD